ncbi:GntR family transcriptional regulator [Glycomyces paridis]|uniref:GntR family transcriptional regulator n=1 Tax=Glycomyces paridis TaxID=2126555 RepID=A0A4S8PG77_9ACTN|nr:GntR family transcriptional regulator [Glycomyces paridis]THV29500.1 GntR family transcriptional regulator [Glycomyces paridis]
MIEFRLDRGSGVTPYLQLIRQVRQAVRLGRLREGDRLPPAREVVAALGINPNTVHKAYRELEHDGLVRSRPGVGTFVTAGAAASDAAQDPGVRSGLTDWVEAAERAGLDHEDMRAVFDSVLAERDAARTGSGRT